MAKKPLSWLIENVEKVNLAEDLDKGLIGEITNKVVTGFDIDEASRSEWLEVTEEGLKIAEQITETKSYPWDGAANVKFPLIAISAIQFAARAYPNIVNGSKVVKAATTGQDADGEKEKRARRISEHMSYQLTTQMPEWEEDTDQLLHALPVVGVYYRKTYFDPLLGRNKSVGCSPIDVVVNENTKDFDTCRRVTHRLFLYKNEVIEKQNYGRYIGDAEQYFTTTAGENEEAEMFLEQHRWLDLDGDGYEEPYIVTVHYASQTLVRIIARYDYQGVELLDNDTKLGRIEPIKYFTKYGFIPSSSGKFHSLGFAHLLGPINESMNTAINQLLDAGTMSNLQGGFLGSGIRFKGGKVRFKPGEWKPVETMGGVLKDNIVPIPTKEPSMVLFQLLGMLNDAGMKLASVSETMTGETPSQNTPATTTLAVIEQGLKVFTAIYKRIFRSLTQEYKKLYRLNSIYMDEEEYYTIMDTTEKVARSDYALADYDVTPVADPNLSSETQKLAKSQAVMSVIEMNPTKSGKLESLRMYYESIDAGDVNKLLPPEEVKQILEAKPPPDPDLIETQLKALKQQHDYEMAVKDQEIELIKKQHEIDKLKAETRKTIAEVDAMPINQHLQALREQVTTMHNNTKLEIQALKELNAMEQGGQNGKGNSPGNTPRGAGGMGQQPNNNQGVQVPGAGGAGLPQSANVGPDLEGRLDGANVNPDITTTRPPQGNRAVNAAASISEGEPAS